MPVLQQESREKRQKNVTRILQCPISQPPPSCGRLLRVQPPQHLPISCIQEAQGAAVFQVELGAWELGLLVAHHLDALDSAQLDQSVPADDEGEEDGCPRNTSEAPVGLFDEVFEIHTVEAGDECAHGQT